MTDPIIAYLIEGALYCPECAVIEDDDVEFGHAMPRYAEEHAADLDHCCGGCGHSIGCLAGHDDVACFPCDKWPPQATMRAWKAKLEDNYPVLSIGSNERSHKLMLGRYANQWPQDPDIGLWVNYVSVMCKAHQLCKKGTQSEEEAVRLTPPVERLMGAAERWLERWHARNFDAF